MKATFEGHTEHQELAKNAYGDLAGPETFAKSFVQTGAVYAIASMHHAGSLPCCIWRTHPLRPKEGRAP